MAPALRLVKHLKWMSACLALAIVAGCGGGGGSDGVTACVDNPNRDPRLPSCTGAPGATIASLELLVSSPQLPTDGTATVVLTVRALDGNRLGVAGQPVQLSVEDPAGTAFVSNFSQAASGSTTQHPTDGNGQLTATLNAGSSKANRTITIKASASGVGASTTVVVTGTTIRFSGANALGFGASTRLAMVLADASGVPVPGVAVTFSSAAGNGLSPTQATTDVNGTVVTTVTGTKPGRDTIGAAAIGASNTFELTVSNDNFSFTVPATGAVPQVPVNAPQLLVVRWTAAGAGVAGAVVNFQATRGTLSATQAVTSATGEATVAIVSPFPGASIVTATAGSGSLTATTNVVFVATAAASKVDLQADRTTVATNPAGSSANVVNLIAVARDAADNLVRGAQVTFTIDQDTSGGALSAASAVTDVNGMARVQYIPSANSSPTNGVVIRATLRDASGGAVANASITLTVGGQRLFVRIGTDNSIQDVPPNYIIKYSAFVTDAAGNPVPNASVQFLLRTRQDAWFDPVRTGDASYVQRFLQRDQPPPGVTPSYDYAYYKGYWQLNGGWEKIVTARCFNEDVNFNGIRDPGEDLDADAKLDPGNAFSVAQTLSTNAAGFAMAEITYPQDRALWTILTLKATAQVAGTEASESATFLLPIAADDLDPRGTPPGYVSPYGRSGSCSDPN